MDRILYWLGLVRWKAALRYMKRSHVYREYLLELKNQTPHQPVKEEIEDVLRKADSI